MLIALSIGGCSTTRYLGPLDVVTPVTRSYPSNVPRVVSVSGTQATLGYPGGGTQLISTDSTYVQLEHSPGTGALEGFLGGAVLGAVTVAANSSSCSDNDCTAALLVAPLVIGALGALYGAVVGHKTTYVLGPRPR
jgi:glycerol uptake facilitator-like aquaporin